MKMPKVTVLGMGHSGYFSYMIVKKDGNFFRWLKAFLEMAFDYKGMVDVRESDYKEGEEIAIVPKNIEDFTDKHESYGVSAFLENMPGTGARIDIFYGKNKVFIVILTDLQNRQRFLKVLKKISVWKK